MTLGSRSEPRYSKRLFRANNVVSKTVVGFRTVCHPMFTFQSFVWTLLSAPAAAG